MINKIRFYAYKILPLVYDQSLSYYETVCKCVAKINEIIGYVEGAFLDNIKEVISDIVLDAVYDESTETLTIDIDIPE